MGSCSIMRCLAGFKIQGKSLDFQKIMKIHIQCSSPFFLTPPTHVNWCLARICCHHEGAMCILYASGNQSTSREVSKSNVLVCFLSLRTNIHNVGNPTLVLSRLSWSGLAGECARSLRNSFSFPSWFPPRAPYFHHFAKIIPTSRSFVVDAYRIITFFVCTQTHTKILELPSLQMTFASTLWIRWDRENQISAWLPQVKVSSYLERGGASMDYGEIVNSKKLADFLATATPNCRNSIGTAFRRMRSRQAVPKQWLWKP